MEIEQTNFEIHLLCCARYREHIDIFLTYFSSYMTAILVPIATRPNL